MKHIPVYLLLTEPAWLLQLALAQRELRMQ